MDSGIYIIRNEFNCKIYIGQAKSIKKRCQRHKTDLKCKRHKNQHLQRAYDVYGEINFTFSVLELCDINFLNEREDYWVKVLKSTDVEYGYNIRPTDVNNKPSHSEESREKIRKYNLGLKHPEWRNKIKSISQSGEKHWTKHKSFSEESKVKMSETHKKLFQNGYIHPRKGVKETSEEIEAKRIRSSKPVLQFTLEGILVEEFASVKEAHIKYGFSQCRIGLCCNGKIKKYKNYVWKFKQ
jgi:group I intron endonuclease